MKYVVIIGDGMADRPMAELNGMTILQKAVKPNMDWLAGRGVCGMVRTIPAGLPPGSDVANLSIMGYDPRQYYTGRAPLEAVSMGIRMGDEDVAYRCNLVTLSLNGGSSHAVMIDHSSGHITSEEGRELIAALSKALGEEDVIFYPGVSYRHLMIWKKGSVAPECTPPHDILDKKIDTYLPSGDESGRLRDMMQRSQAILKEHPVNKKRRADGKRTADSIWLWGQGKRPSVPTYNEKYGIRGALISAVDLTKGLGLCAGLDIINVPGATGWIDTNYAGKAEYALNALADNDFIYIHVEAPDEAGHAGSLEYKLKAVEDLDSKLIGPLLAGMKERFGDFRVLLMPDHATPVSVRTHTDEAVPFVIYDSRGSMGNSCAAYDESIAADSGRVIFEKGYNLMDQFIRGELGKCL
jgi:2,3-bisphosphoglycerate-independent phosphoglycerate mutase